jgi:transposase
VARVIIGMDPHKRSATIEVIDEREKVIAQGRFATDTAGYQAMLKVGRRYAQRVWAVEGCNGIGRHIAQRLVADGEPVLDVPAKLSARARVFATGQGRKTDPVDAHSVAVAALRSPGLRQVTVDDATVALRLLADRRDGLGRARTDIVCRLHALLLELVPGGAKKDLSAPQARALLNTVRPRDIVGRTRRQLASDLNVAVFDFVDGPRVLVLVSRGFAAFAARVEAAAPQAAVRTNRYIRLTEWLPGSSGFGSGDKA